MEENRDVKNEELEKEEIADEVAEKDNETQESNDAAEDRKSVV